MPSTKPEGAFFFHSVAGMLGMQKKAIAWEIRGELPGIARLGLASTVCVTPLVSVGVFRCSFVLHSVLCNVITRSSFRCSLP